MSVVELERRYRRMRMFAFGLLVTLLGVAVVIVSTWATIVFGGWP